MTYPAPEVTQLLGEFVPVKVDITVDTALADRYGVQSSPDLFLLSPEGQVVDRITRFVAAADLADFLKAGLFSPDRIRPGPSIPWVRSFADAEREARRTGKSIFVYVWNYG